MNDLLRATVFADRLYPYTPNRERFGYPKSQNSFNGAMYELEIQLLTVVPGQTPCLACLYPHEPPAWQRRFPVFGAVAGTVGCLGAMEAVKLLAGSIRMKLPVPRFSA